MKILGIGNAIIDVICKVEESFLTKNNLTKGTMKLIFDNKEFKNKSKISLDVSRLKGQFVFLISLDGVEQKKTSIIIQ